MSNTTDNQMYYHPELALFYNRAYERMLAYIAKDLGIDLDVARSTTIKHFVNSKENKTELYNKYIGSDVLQIRLKNYMWKGYNEDKNKSGTSINPKDKKIISSLLTKLEDLRNFHSHFYHPKDVLLFDDELFKFVQGKFDYAKAQLRGKYASQIDEYFSSKHKDIFENKQDEQHNTNKKHKISEEGLNFFLSFFLTQGEMEMFLKKRRGCKRKDNFYAIKYRLYNFYTHRDGAARITFNQKEDDIFDKHLYEEILKKRQFYKIASYLNDVPQEINNPSLFPRHEDILDLKNRKFELYLCEEDKHRISVDLMRKADFLDKYNQKISYFIEEREEMIKLVESADTIKKELRDSYEKDKCRKILNSYGIFKLRTTNPELIRSYREWMFCIDINLNKEKKEREELLRLLRETKIELRYLDFYYQEKEKPRSKREFMAFAVNYLKDFNILSNVKWHFKQEKIVENQGEKKIARKNAFINHPQTDTDLRPAFLEDMQILLRYGDSPIPFVIGKKAMRNLLIAHFDGKELDSFFKTLTDQALCLYKGQTYQGKNILSKNEIPQRLKNEYYPDLKKIIETRINYIIGELNKSLEKKDQLCAAEKNRQIMRCYRLYDWDKRKNGTEIFLRRKEYNEMSVLHYTLGKETIENLDKIAQSNGAMPKEIKELICESKNIDDLFSKVLTDTLENLKNKKDTLSFNKRLGLEAIARKLSIRIPQPPKYVSGDDNDYLPFSVHPILPLRFFYADELKKHTKSEVGCEGNSSFSLSKMFKEQNNQKIKLKSKHYEIGNAAGEDIRQKRKIKGVIDDLFTYDSILFKIAKKYDKNFKQVDETISDNEFELFEKYFSYIKNSNNPPKLNIKVKYHQMDDLLLAIKNGRLENGTRSLYMRFKDDPQRLSDEFGVTASGYCAKALSNVLNELNRVYEESLLFIEAILMFEEDVINNSAETDYCEDEYVDFDKILFLKNLSNGDKSTLNKIRKAAMHTMIPTTWSYNSMIDNKYLKPFIDKIKIARANKKERIKEKIESKKHTK